MVFKMCLAVVINRSRVNSFRVITSQATTLLLRDKFQYVKSDIFLL